MHNLTGKSCRVSPFSASYDPVHDVQIASLFTAYTYEYGRTYILVFNIFLWFGTSMDHSLVNKNQIIMTGIPVSGDLFDENWKLGIA